MNGWKATAFAIDFRFLQEEINCKNGFGQRENGQLRSLAAAAAHRAVIGRIFALIAIAMLGLGVVRVMVNLRAAAGHTTRAIRRAADLSCCWNPLSLHKAEIDEQRGS